MGPFICGFFFNNYLYYFPSVVGSPQIQRPSCMHLSKPFYIGYLISVCVWWGACSGIKPPWTSSDNLSFGESKVILEILTVQEVDVPNPGIVQGSNV